MHGLIAFELTDALDISVTFAFACIGQEASFTRSVSALTIDSIGGASGAH
jgi:hypothetical protein